MSNLSLAYLLSVVITLSIILAAVEIVSISGTILVIVLMSVASVVVWQERVRCEKQYLAEKLYLERKYGMAKQSKG